MEVWEQIHNDYDLGDVKYKTGDIVTRDGTDRQEIVDIDYDWLIMNVRCIKEPDIWGDVSGPWIKIGEVEDNLIRRYSLVESKIDE